MYVYQETKENQKSEYYILHIPIRFNQKYQREILRLVQRCLVSYHPLFTSSIERKKIFSSHYHLTLDVRIEKIQTFDFLKITGTLPYPTDEGRRFIMDALMAIYHMKKEDFQTSFFREIFDESRKTMILEYKQQETSVSSRFYENVRNVIYKENPKYSTKQEIIDVLETLSYDTFETLYSEIIFDTNLFLYTNSKEPTMISEIKKTKVDVSDITFFDEKKRKTHIALFAEKENYTFEHASFQDKEAIQGMHALFIPQKKIIEKSVKQRLAFEIFEQCYGTSAKSFLFSEVREHHNLCYSIQGSFLNDANCFYIQTALSFEHYEQLKEIICSHTKQSFEQRVKEILYVAQNERIRSYKRRMDNTKMYFDLQFEFYILYGVHFNMDLLSEIETYTVRDIIEVYENLDFSKITEMKIEQQASQKNKGEFHDSKNKI